MGNEEILGKTRRGSTVELGVDLNIFGRSGVRRNIICGLLLGTSITFMPITNQAAGRSADSIDVYAGVVTDYLFRGVSVSENKPAIQAGAEYRHSIGMYTGVFLSNVNTDPYQLPGKDGSRAELEVYAGYGQEYETLGFGWDAGLIAYRFNQNQDNFDEAYVSASFDPWKDHLSVVVKTSYDWSNKNLVLEAKGALDVGKGFELVLIPGYVNFNNKLREDYGFVTLGADTRFEIKNIIETLDLGVYYTTTDKDKRPDDNRNLVRDSWWLSLVAHF